MSKARQQANLSSDGNLFADISNDRVGVGSVAPSHKLTVSGSSKLDDVTVGTGGQTTAIGVRLNSQYAQIKLPDGQTGGDKKGNLSFGDNDDFRIVFDAHHTYLTQYDGNMYFGFATHTPLRVMNSTASVELYYGGTKRFETTNTGAKVTGNLEVTGVMTYDDVTSVDSIGIVTARAGVHIDDSIVHIGDTNTKIRFPAADTITAETGGSERIRITSDGKIGINETSPQDGLHVNESTIYRGIFVNGNTAPRIAFARNTTTTGEWSVGVDGTNGNQFAINNSDGNSNRKLIISSSQITLYSNTNISGVTQITKGTSGGATANTDAALILDNSSHTYVQFRTPSDKEQGILFGDVQDNNVGSIAYSHSTNALTFGTNAGERLRLLSGGGITFNGDTAAANALNDYEEGTWTPVLKNGTNTITHTTGNASTRFKYTKIGRLVHLMFCLNNETTGGTTGGNSNFQVTGTPFVPANERIISSQVLWYNTGLRINQTPVFMHLHTSGTLDSYRMVSATGGYTSTNCEVEQVGGSSYMFFQLTYETDS